MGREVRRTATVVAALGAGAWLFWPVWVVSHPLVRVDNALPAPIDLWVDGKRLGTVPRHGPQGEPPGLRIRAGRHKLGWSWPGEGAPREQSDAEISLWGALLYSPGASACHWLTVTAYGTISTHGEPHGPGPLQELAHLDHVDDWFAPSPATVPLPPFTEGAVRTSLQRWEACMDLKGRGCAKDVVRDYVDCMRTIDGRAGVGDCWGEALRSCSPGTARTAGP